MLPISLPLAQHLMTLGTEVNGSRFLPSGSTQATGANKHRNQWEAALKEESILGRQGCKCKAWQGELVW